MMESFKEELLKFCVDETYSPNFQIIIDGVEYYLSCRTQTGPTRQVFLSHFAKLKENNMLIYLYEVDESFQYPEHAIKVRYAYLDPKLMKGIND